jgi:hypothetical protein
MKKQLLICLLAFAATAAQAQQKIKDGTVASSALPGANSLLELESNNKGLLLPRLALTSTANPSPTSAHVQGMFVYNTATINDVTPGIYYNDGTQWQQAKFATCQGFGTRTVSGSQVHPGGGVFTKVIFTGEDWDQGNVFSPGAGTSTFTATQAGKYIITGSAFTNAAAVATNRALNIFKNGVSLVQGDNTQIDIGQGFGLKVSFIADLAAGDVVDLRLYVLNSASVSVTSASFSAVKADCGSGTSGGATINDEPWRNTSDGLGATSTSANIYYNNGALGVGTTTPAAGSLVELQSTQAGLRMPQIALTNTTTWLPLAGSGAASTSPGMSVYNTNAAIASTNANYPANGLGEYSWDGTGWINKNSAVTQNSLVLFSVKRTTQQSIGASGVWTVVDFTAKDYDKNNNYNLTNNTFTVPANAAGYYQVNLLFATTVQAGNQGSYVGVFVNGVFRRYITIANANAGSGITGSGTITLPLAAGDVVSIRYNANTASQEIATIQVDMNQLSR